MPSRFEERLTRNHSPFLLFFMNASSPPSFSSISLAFSLVLSLVLGLEMVALASTSARTASCVTRSRLEPVPCTRRPCWRYPRWYRGYCPWDWIGLGYYLWRCPRQCCHGFGLPCCRLMWNLVIIELVCVCVCVCLEKLWMRCCAIPKHGC